MATTTHHDSCFVTTSTDANLAAAASKRVHIPVGKRLERQLITLWKVLTRSRRKQRASFMPKDFVSVTYRRRSTMPPRSRVRV